MDEFRELEYKYRADNVTFMDFIALMEQMNPLTKKEAASWDHYYTGIHNENEFIRYRESDSPELTRKFKVQSGNNWDRVEVDLPLDPSKITKTIVNKWVEVSNYSSNFSIYKVCTIYFFENTNYVYYITFDKNMKELDRFIEVEVNKSKIPNMTSNPGDVLTEASKKLEKLGLSSQNRMKKSLFELYRK